MNEELYIKGEKVDLGSGTITLKYQSNFLGDITKIQTNFSYTVSVPKTANNTRIFSQSDMPSAAVIDNFPRRYNEAVYFRNGIELFTGSAILLKSTEKAFEFCLNWGELTDLRDFVNNEKTINQLFDKSFAQMWDNNSINNTPSNATEGFFEYYGGRAIIGVNVRLLKHPFVKLTKIIDLIKNATGMNFIFPSTIQSRLNHIALLCMTKKDTPESMTKYPLDASLRRFQNEVQNHHLLEVHSLKYSVSNFIAGISQIGIKRDTNSLYVKVRVNFQTSSGSFGFLISKSANGGEASNTNNDILRVTGTQTGNTIYDISVKYEGTVNVSLSADTNLYFYTFGNYTTTNQYHSEQNYILLNIDPYRDNETALNIEYGGMFPIFANLPPLKFVDIIKTVCYMFGLYAHRHKTDSSNTVRFSHIELLSDNKQFAVDWSEKTINRHKHIPEQIIYRYGSMSEYNYLRYKKDDEDDFEDYAFIKVEDETLSRWRDLITLEFAASNKWDVNQAFIPQYSIKTTPDTSNQTTIRETEFKELQPRILSVPLNSNSKYLRFEPELTFETLKNLYYQEYQRLMRRPIVITETFKLSELDLKNLDFTIPVYLRQYGQYYAIITIEDRGGICKAEMLQL